MSRNAKSQWNGGVDNGIDGGRNVGGEDLFPSELFVSPVSGEPDFSQGAFFGKNDLGVKHDELLDENERVRGGGWGCSVVWES